MQDSINRRDWDTLGFFQRANNGRLCVITKIMCNLDGINPGKFPGDSILMAFDNPNAPTKWTDEILLIPDELGSALWSIRPVKGGIVTDDSLRSVLEAEDACIYELDLRGLNETAMTQLSLLFPDITFGDRLFLDCEELMHSLVNHGAVLGATSLHQDRDARPRPVIPMKYEVDISGVSKDLREELISLYPEAEVHHIIFVNTEEEVQLLVTKFHARRLELAPTED